MEPSVDTKHHNISPQTEDLTGFLAFEEGQQTSLVQRRERCANCNQPIPEKRKKFGYETCKPECTSILNNKKRRTRKIIYTHCQYSQCGEPISEDRQSYGAMYCPSPKDCGRLGWLERQEDKKKFFRLWDEAKFLNFLYDNPAFKDEILIRIKRCIDAGRPEISGYWIGKDIRQFTDYKFPDYFIPYMISWIIEHYPQYEHYFVREEKTKRRDAA